MGLLDGQKIIIVDDSAVNLLLAARVLKMEGAEVLEADNGMKAIQLLEENSGVSMVFLDLDMPIMDGFTVAQLIRYGGKSFSGVTILALSGAEDAVSKKKALDAGMDGFLIKPLQQQALQAFFMPDSKSAETKDPANENKELEADFDLSYITMATGGIQQHALEIVKHTASTAMPLLWQAIDAAKEEKWAETASHVHKLKGLLSIFGMQSITNVLLTMERQAIEAIVVKENILHQLYKISDTLPALLQAVEEKVEKQH